MVVNSKIKRIFFVLIIWFLPLLSFASIITCNEPDKCNLDEIFNIFDGLITWFTGIFSSVAAIGFAVAGIRMLIYPSNTSERESAKRMLIYVSVGYLIFMTGVLIIKTIVSELVTSSINPLRFFK